MLGVCLWWPRRWTRAALRPVTLFDSRLRGRAREFNWHNVIGIWCAPVLLVLTLTGVVMSYQWANDLLCRLSGSEPPPPAERSARTAAGGRGERPAEQRQPAGLDALWARAERQVPGWVAIGLRVPARSDGPVVFVIQEPAGWDPAPRSQLTLDPVTAEIVRWEPFTGRSLGRRLRTWVRPLHTGEAGGLAGQSIALAASAAAAVLAWTGLAPAGQEVSAD